MFAAARRPQRRNMACDGPAAVQARSGDEKAHGAQSPGRILPMDKVRENGDEPLDFRNEFDELELQPQGNVTGTCVLGDDRRNTDLFSLPIHYADSSGDRDNRPLGCYRVIATPLTCLHSGWVRCAGYACRVLSCADSCVVAFRPQCVLVPLP